MVKVIETNLSIDFNGNIRDHQSRVIEVESWDSFVEEIKTATPVYRISIFNEMEGNSIHQGMKVENLIYDDYHLSCDTTNTRGIKSKKFVYNIDR